jgi:hypothetical protein
LSIYGTEKAKSTTSNTVWPFFKGLNNPALHEEDWYNISVVRNLEKLFKARVKRRQEDNS